jgi:exonuclease V gamma subunit
MFLETLLSARDHVTLSYVARDEITGDELPARPCCSSCAPCFQGYLDPAQLALAVWRRHQGTPPLRRYDDIAGAARFCPPPRPSTWPRSWARPWPRATLGRRSRPRLRASRRGEQRSADARDVSVIPLSALRRFLEDPLQGSARFRLGMHDDDDRAPADVEDEPFDMDKRGSSWLLRASMTDALVAAQATPPWQDLLAAYQRRASRAELGGQCPTGLFRSASTQVEARAPARLARGIARNPGTRARRNAAWSGW